MILAHTDFEATPIYTTPDDGLIPKTEFTKAFQDVFVDPSGSVNVFGGWEKGDVEMVGAIRVPDLYSSPYSCDTMPGRPWRCSKTSRRTASQRCSYARKVSQCRSLTN